MRVVFLAPTYPPEMIEYTRGLAEVGATVTNGAVICELIDPA